MSQAEAQEPSIVAVVIWYHPEISFLENIISYSSNVDDVIIVDNSENDNMLMLKDLPEVHYISLHHNAGIAAALNRGVAAAAALGADWVLTMDQDSRFAINDIEFLVASAWDMQDDTEVAVVGAITDPKLEKTFEYNEVSSVITSGSLNRLSSIQAVGGFDEKLFIDCVDFDFCFRLRRSGYKIIMDKSCKLDHRRGTPTIFTWRGRTWKTYNYSSIRYYYQVRNNLYLGRRFPDYRKESKRKVHRILRNVLFFETNKLSKLSAIVQGIVHFFVRRSGPRDQTFKISYHDE